MTDLIATLEGLTGPSREVDEAMRIHFKYPPKPWNYTASLDAITALVERVLPGWAKGFDGGPKTCIAFVDPYDHDDRMFGARYTACAPTPAIALCIALIRALEARDVR